MLPGQYCRRKIEPLIIIQALVSSAAKLCLFLIAVVIGGRQFEPCVQDVLAVATVLGRECAYAS